MKEQINNRLERMWAEVTQEMLQAETLGDIKKIFVAYGFLENVILNMAEDIEDPELKVRLLNYCEFAMKAVHDFNSKEEAPTEEKTPVKSTTSAKILQFPKK